MSFRTVAKTLPFFALIAWAALVAPCQGDLAASAAVKGCLSERSGKLILTDFDGNSFVLEGRTAELKAHVGDELSISGHIRAAGSEGGEEPSFRVVSFSTIVRKNPAGVKARLGDPSDWATSQDVDFGLVIRLPKSFPEDDADPDRGLLKSNFVDTGGVVPLHGWSIPGGAYPGSNFEGGYLEVSVNPSIRNQGTCLQFAEWKQGSESSEKFGGVSYAEAVDGGLGLGTADTEVYLHTFQNNFCYEVAVLFVERDGTGMDDRMCTIEWLSADNKEELLNSLLSRVTFGAPKKRNLAILASAQHPVVTSLEQSLSSKFAGADLTVTWSTEGADYVQLQYGPCIEGLELTVDNGAANIKCSGPSCEVSGGCPFDLQERSWL